MSVTSTFPSVVNRITESRLTQVDLSNPLFGKEPTDHMFIAEFADGQWRNPRIEPFQSLTFSPFTLAFHYGQTVFEGIKAFRRADGDVSIFRVEKHYERFTRSLDRMCMPAPSFEWFKQGLHAFVDLDQNWIPDMTDGSLYIRPFVIATEERLGVKISEEYLFMIVAAPAGPYYGQPLRVKIETEFVRAAPGGTGFAKCGGNYGGAFYPSRQAREQGFDQVIWTDSSTHQFIEESGTMNLLFVIDGTLVTPPLSGTILDGITRDSILTLAQSEGIPTEVRPLPWQEIQTALQQGRKVEAFGAGTAAVIAPIEWIQFGNQGFSCYTQPDALMYRFKQQLSDIRTGRQADPHGWNHIVSKQ